MENTTSASTLTRSKRKSVVLLQTAKTMAFKDGEAKGISVRILLDNGSQQSYITESLKTRLKLEPVKQKTLHLNTFGGEKVSKNGCSLVKFYLLCKEGKRIEIQALSFPKICTPLPAQIDLSDYPHLEDLELADPLDSESQVEPVDILIGSDMYWEIVNGDVIRENTGPIAVSSKFGWVISGPVKGSHVNVASVANLVINAPELSQSNHDPIISELRRFWETDSTGIIDDPKSEQDTPFLKKFSFDGERYKVGLPWKEVEIEPLPVDYNLSLNRLNSLYSRLKEHPDILKEYNNIIQEQEKMGIIEEVPKTEQTNEFYKNNDCHFIPHHGVCRKDRETTKLRIVFDGSAKTSERKLSMNDYLNNGPNFIPPLFDILTRFRAKPIALVADVEKAFLQISIEERDRNTLPFVWYQPPSEGQGTPVLKQYRFCRLMFGLKPSPSILGFVISEHLKKFEETEPQTVDTLRSQLFVDDFLGGTDSVEEGFKLYKTSKTIMNSGSFRLRKWVSNSPELSELICNEENTEIERHNTKIIEDDQTFTKESFGPKTIYDEKTKTKVLGLNWDISSDEFYFDFNELISYANSLTPTKRSVLKVTAKIYDPLGYLCPFTVKLKKMFQDLCTENVTWDDELQGEMRMKFSSIIFDLNRLQDVRLPRCLFTKFAKAQEYELHGFSDSSSKAYAGAVYFLTRYEDNTISVNLIASKARIAPLKQQTIPRLELLGAHLLAKLMKTINESLEKAMKIKLKCFYWVDSNVALCWIKNERVWKQYVQNRVNEIRKLSSLDDWRFCPGAVNPADLPSRGLNANELIKSEVWMKGPQFLKEDKSKWPKIPNTFETKEAYDELVKITPKVTHALAVETLSEPKFIEFERFSSKTRLVRTFAWVLRFIEILKQRLKKEVVSEELQETLTVNELNRAENLIIRFVQSESFANEKAYLEIDKPRVKPPNLIRDFALFIDEEGIIRCKTRLKHALVIDGSKSPILLPSKHYFTTLTIRQIHANSGHNSISYTLSACRERFWILRGRRSVKTAIKNCNICIRFCGHPFSTAPCYDLPRFRVDDAPPFTNTGVDFAGPLFVKNTDGTTSKSYVCLYTCASTRAVHLDLVHTLDTETFFRSFRRFTARRGLPKLLISDNAKTFKSACKDIRRITRSNVTRDLLTKKGVVWRFIPERSPWFGAFYERMIGTVKSCLRKTIGRAMLSYDELTTILIEIECIVNNRPISYVYDDNEGVSYALTPSHLIYGRRITTLPSDAHYEVFNTTKALTKRAKHHMKLIDNFTKSWKRNYLLNLRERTMKNDGFEKENKIRIGEIVLLKDEKSRRMFWKLAKVENVIKGPDGIARIATVKVLNNDKRTVNLKRSIKHLIPMEVRQNEDSKGKDNDQRKKGELQNNNLEDQRERPRRDAKAIGEIRRKDQTTLR